MDIDTDERYLVAPTSTSRHVELNFTNEEQPFSVKHQISKVSAAPQPLSSLSSSGLKHFTRAAVRTEASTFIEQQRKILSPRVCAEHTTIAQTNQSDLNMTKISSFFGNNGTNVSQASVKG